MTAPETNLCSGGQHDPTVGALDLTGINLGAVIAYASASADIAHWTHRMLQALDIYWLHYDPPPRMDRVRSESSAEDWWGRFEKYRARVESLIALRVLS